MTRPRRIFRPRRTVLPLSIPTIPSQLVSRGLITREPMVGPLQPGQERPFKYTLTKPWSEYTEVQQEELKELGFTLITTPPKINLALNRLVAAGAVNVSEDGQQVTLRTPMEQLPDNLYKDAISLGFTDKGTTGKTITRQYYDEIAKDPRKYYTVADIISFDPKGATQAEKTAVILGAFENFFGGIWGFLTGGEYSPKTVTPSTVAYARNLPASEKFKLDVMAFAGNTMAVYLASLGIGAVADLTIAGATKIASGLGLTTPSGIAKIALKISNSPKLSTYVQYGVTAGLNTPSMVALYKTGTKAAKGEVDLDDFALQLANVIAGIAVGKKGFKTGAEKSKWLRDWYNTRKAIKFDFNQLTPPEIVDQWKTGRFPKYTEKTYAEMVEEFKRYAKEYNAEEVLGDLSKNRYRTYHTTSKNWGIKEGGIATVKFGDTRPIDNAPNFETVKKFPGLFVDSVPSKYFLRVGSKTYQGDPTKLVLPGRGGTPAIMVIDTNIGVMPKFSTTTEVWTWLGVQAGKNKVYIPPSNMISPEMEAIVPSTTTIIRIPGQFATKVDGSWVLVEKWALVGDDMIDVVGGMSLPKGSTLSTLGTRIIENPMTPESYLTWGVLPTATSFGSSQISSKEVSSLAAEYNISEAEVISILSSLGTSISTSTSAITAPSTLSTSKVSSVLEGNSPIPLSAVPPPAPLPLVKLEIPTRDIKSGIYKKIMKFEVKLLYLPASQKYIVKSKSFHGAAKKTLMRRKSSKVPKRVKVRIIEETTQKL